MRTAADNVDVRSPTLRFANSYGETNKMKLVHGVAAIGFVGLGVLAGCSSSSDSSSSTAGASASASSSVTKDAEYASVVELKDAAVAAGLACPDFAETTATAPVAESGTCGGGTVVLATYASQADQDKATDALKSSKDKAVVLVGTNWTITDAPNTDALQDELGGVVVQTGVDVSAEATASN